MLEVVTTCGEKKRKERKKNVFGIGFLVMEKRRFCLRLQGWRIICSSFTFLIFAHRKKRGVEDIFIVWIFDFCTQKEERGGGYFYCLDF